MTKTVLIIEDDRDISDLISLHLRDLGCRTESVADGNDGLDRALSRQYDLIILDVMLPGMDGFEICRQLRDQRMRLPILMLTAKSEELDKVLGLEFGADDYLTKPFSIRELTARVKAILRRVEAMAKSPGEQSVKAEIHIGDLSIDMEKRKVVMEGRAIELTAKEFDLLALFARYPGRCFSRHQLLDTVWGYQFNGYDHTVNTHINRLRAKIEGNPSRPKYIQTVWGVGYKFAESEELER
ncbi:MAG: response regulator transcription factor [Bacteroidota bacterium]